MLKKYLSYLLLNRSGNNAKSLQELERRQENPFSADFNDSFYFTGRDEKGNTVITRLGFRNSGETELWLDLAIPGAGNFRITHDRERFIRGDDVSYGPLEYTCIEPGRIWRITFNGAMMCGKRKAHVIIDLLFTGKMHIFDFKKDGNLWTMAEAIASEKWSREWFGKLKELSQVHYEQGGTMTGFIQINGTKKKLDMKAMRDHSFGTRNWSAMDRHLWICGMLEDGNFFNMSLVRYTFLNFLQSGFITIGDRFVPAEQCSRFEDIGEAVEVPGKFEFFIKPLNMDLIEVECTLKDGFDYLMGGGYSINESIADFKFGNIKGVGISEFGYNTKIYS